MEDYLNQKEARVAYGGYLEKEIYTNEVQFSIIPKQKNAIFTLA
ncbi:hypothetical protein [Flavobacterium piscinae]|nr:hypothetical protein [Flavobacterium piscinae]